MPHSFGQLFARRLGCYRLPGKRARLCRIKAGARKPALSAMLAIELRQTVDTSSAELELDAGHEAKPLGVGAGVRAVATVWRRGVVLRCAAATLRRKVLPASHS